MPEIFARHRLTVHVPRGPYTGALRGIPTIRPFEAMACGIPLVTSPWEDSEGLFTAGRDYLLARDGKEMREKLALLLHDEGARRELSEHALATIRARHTCVHRAPALRLGGPLARAGHATTVGAISCLYPHSSRTHVRVIFPPRAIRSVTNGAPQVGHGWATGRVHSANLQVG